MGILNMRNKRAFEHTVTYRETRVDMEKYKKYMLLRPLVMLYLLQST